MRRCYILGAGFSKVCGLPLAREGSISVLKRAFKLNRCWFKGFKHYAASVGLAVLCHKRYLEQEAYLYFGRHPGCRPVKTKTISNGLNNVPLPGRLSIWVDE